MMIKRALSESGCPPHILDDLMENCHERRWPRGLSSLETRQNNRRIYEKYVCRRIPGKKHESDNKTLINVLFELTRQTGRFGFKLRQHPYDRGSDG